MKHGPKTKIVWTDSHGRAVSPTFSNSDATESALLCERSKLNEKYGPTQATPKKYKPNRIDLFIANGQNLGLKIRGGYEYNLGIYITGVDKNSVAEKAGLKVGDQILEVNEISFMKITHDAAVNHLKHYKRMSILVRHVGKIPNFGNFDNKFSKENQEIRFDEANESMDVIEEKAQTVLPPNEFVSLKYYIKEYTSKRISIDLFVEVLLDLLDSPEKCTLLTEIREIVLLSDRSHFDNMVYKCFESANNQHLKDNWSSLSDDDIGSPSNDSGLGLCWNNLDQVQKSRIRCQNEQIDGIDGLYCFENDDTELARKLSRSLDFKASQPLLGAENDVSDLHVLDSSIHGLQSPQQELLPPQQQCHSKVSTESNGKLRISVLKTKPFLGIAIEGGVNTKHPLPRIINIHNEGSAFKSGGLEVGQLILEVDGRSVRNLEHQEVAKLIADSYAQIQRPSIEFLVVEAKKSNLEPKQTSYVFLEA